MPARLSASSFPRRGLIGWAGPGPLPSPLASVPSPSEEGAGVWEAPRTSGARRAPSRRAWARGRLMSRRGGEAGDSNQRLELSSLQGSRFWGGVTARWKENCPSPRQDGNLILLGLCFRVCEIGRTIINLLHKVVRIKKFCLRSSAWLTVDTQCYY